MVATETTAQVVDRRRLSCFGSLARALVGATSIESVTNVTIDALRDCEPATAIATNPCRPFDEEYEQFIDLLRAAVSASMTAALVRADEIGALRVISDTLQDAMLELASDLPTVAARYLPLASNLTVGGDWYDVLDLGGGRRGLIVGDCVGHGLAAATAIPGRAPASTGSGTYWRWWASPG